MNKFFQHWQQWFTAYSRPVRYIRHALIWLIIWILSSETAHFGVQDKPSIDLAVTVLIALSTLLYFYVLGYFVFPVFLYRFRPVWLVSWLILTYWFSYLLNRLVFIELQPYSLSATSYLSKIAHMVQAAGPLGCFTSIKVALWNYVLGLYMVTLLLVMKSARDIISNRNRSIRLEGDRLRLERDKLALEGSHLTLELDFLKMQISPHFLFNTLNTIYARVVDADEQAANQVLRLAELMRYNLYEANADRIGLELELNYINDYLQLEQARHAQWISVTLEADDRVEQYQIAPLLLNTFVENAFKHGVRAGNFSYVLITARMDGDTLEFTVQNTLQPETRASGRKSGGVGLVNVRKRLDLLYPNRYALTTGPVKDQYVVTLRLQLEPLAVPTR
ncbi:sensor histidine kinase [Spirosoma pollinicola]|uniref:Signal transduction histidine kinase internal region domain-containing protein n=1 Tax=Spirosoma pollinicola TaxID=2057025 RepID=A0A2K8YX04_9BACT|nr:histidine kinase [Spirosoma pollinicola]AUD02068.1 hypothetical protein CWM47_09715 [Spirosoma pollinicola]